MKKVNPPKKIIIRSTNWLGDAVMTIPAIRAVRETYQDAHISLMATPLVCELLKTLPCIDSFIPYNKRKEHFGIKGLLRAVKTIRSGNYDLAILLQNAVEAAILMLLGGVPQRMGYNTDGRGLLLTHKVVLRPEDLVIHHKDYYLRMLSNFGIKTSSPGDITLPLPEEAKKGIVGLVPDEYINGKELVIGINPGAHFGSAKRWDEKKFAKVADAVIDEFNAKIIITGGPKEVNIASRVEKHMKNRALNLAGKTTLTQLLPVISLCKVFITNDSGPMHIAAALDKKVVAIFGSTDHMTTSPVCKESILVRKATDCSPCLKRQCPEKHHNCMRLLPAADVIDAAKKFLQ